MQHDVYGRPALEKSLYSFRTGQGAAAIPDELLFDYLCAFVEEACEHECRESAHANLSAKDALATMARAVMSELVQTIPLNANLMKAAKKYKVTADVIAQLLVARGLFKPRSDSDWTDDRESLGAMGAQLLVGEAMAYSLSQRAPWLQAEPAPVVTRQLRDHNVDVSGLVKSDGVDLHTTFRPSRERWFGPDEVAVASKHCALHGHRDLHKAQNLSNPMLPCTCR